MGERSRSVGLRDSGSGATWERMVRAERRRVLRSSDSNPAERAVEARGRRERAFRGRRSSCRVGGG